MKTSTALLCAFWIALAAKADDAVTLKDFQLAGALHDDHADFTLTASAHVNNSRGGEIELLSGPVALSALDLPARERMRAESNRFILCFDRRGDFPVQIHFTAAVTQTDGSNAVAFHVAPSVLQPIVLHGLAADTKINFPGASRPERKGDDFVSYLPSDGAVNFSWKEVRAETEGKLFFAAELLGQISVRPGLMQQTAILNFKVMQGEMDRVTLLLQGEGDVTRVQGEQALSWNVEPGSNAAERRLVIQLNQPQRDQFSLQVQAETPLGAFPQSADAFRVRPENATRFAGYVRVVNDGAVRLEVKPSGGMSQISPEQFPETDATRAAFSAPGNQRFAYRFAGDDFALRLQADQISPELSVSHLLLYHDGENELAIEDGMELDIHEAPLRELAVRIPKGYVVASLNAADMSDYFVTEPPGEDTAELRLVYGHPITGRQLVQLRLERNHGLAETNWTLPRIDIVKAKSSRGFVGVAADPGFRLTPEKTQSLAEIAPAFYPGKSPGLQSAFRLDDAAWSASMRVERLPQTVQVDALHLFSIGEGIAYGSSVLNYVVSGAPTASFKVELSDEYYNVEFAGRDVRNWEKVPGGYIVQLHTPVAGAYTLLATYERPFQSQGQTLAFTGAHPLDAQSEQGYTVIVSAYQFQVKPTDISTGLLPLEPGEVPAEYRLFFDAPILAAYRYASRPFDLKLALSPLAQGESVNQIIDRAVLQTRVSKEGQAVTTARYFVKSRGNPHLRLTLPDGADLWSASINGAAVVPVLDGGARLIPLPQSADPNAVLELDLTLASRSSDPRRVTIGAPIVQAPVMLSEWKLAPDTGQRLGFLNGSLLPVGQVVDVSGFAQVARLFTGPNSARAWTSLLGAVVLCAASILFVRRSSQPMAGLVVALAAIAVTGVVFVQLAQMARSEAAVAASELAFLAPVQQAGSAMTATIANLPLEAPGSSRFAGAWPALIAVPLWLWAFAGLQGARRSAALGLGWLALVLPGLFLRDGAPVFFWVVGAFLVCQTLTPVLRYSFRGAAPGPIGAAPAATALIVFGLFLAHGANAASAPAMIPDIVTQAVRVEKNFVQGTAKLHWQAVKGQTLPLLAEPAVLTAANYPNRALRLEGGRPGSHSARQLVALQNGAFDIDLQYQEPVAARDSETGFVVPTPFGLVNNLNVTVIDADVDVRSPAAVSAQSDHATTNTVASLVLTPAEAWVGWRPRQRDVAREKPVFYSEMSHLLVPTAGVVEEAVNVAIRPAQGELNEIGLTIPPGATVTDVSNPGNKTSVVSLWRFDPDARKLRVSLNPAQSRPFQLLVRLQAATGSLPFEAALGLASVDDAAGQIGLVGIATGNEVQLDAANGSALSPINLEDFPGDVTASLQAQIPGLTVRRAFRYSDASARVTLKASAVEPDVRAETQDTLSLGEDRSVLAATVSVDITRAGIFDLSFPMPEGFDVETISGPALSQWTELKTDAARIVTLHLFGKTIGQQTFALSLAGPGLKTANDWKIPQITLREASKQAGTWLIVPEQGMRLQVMQRDGFTQLDPQKSGIREKGALAFRQLQSPSQLSLDVAQVDPWIQVTSLQHAEVTEAQLKITANLQYQIENTGLKTFRLLLPAEAEGVRFQGDQLGDFQAETGASTNGMQAWNAKLRRRVIGPYLLQVFYQIPLASRATNAVLRGVEASNVNLQRGFVTVQSDPRLQVTVNQTPQALQPSEWQGIPRTLRKDLQTVAADFTYRLVEPSFQLPLKLERHEAAKVLPAHVHNIALHSVISDDGVMLTQATLQIAPGDKRLLALSLPKDAQFWFAFVNDSGVWPWRDGDHLLIPLQTSCGRDSTATVELYYSGRAGQPGGGDLNLELLAPKFELPLENITWRVAMSDQWHVKHWNGSLQFAGEEGAPLPQAVAADSEAYLSNERSLQAARTREAESFVNLGNNSLANGDPQQARRAFEAAFGLSTQDPAFNEDARVQLHNIKLQQALVGLNARNSAVAGDAGPMGGKLRELRSRQQLNYSQQDAKDIFDNNTADDNAAFSRLADKLIQQQEAAAPNPAVIRATIPEQGRSLTFKRAVAVDAWADLNIDLKASMTHPPVFWTRLLILAGALVVLLTFQSGLRSKQIQPRL